MSAELVPTLASVIRRAVEEGAADLHVALPARVEKVDLAKGLVDVKPLVKDRVELDGRTTAVSVPVVPNVPIMWPSGAWGGITFPVAVGDTVLLVFSDRSLDKWLATGGEVDPIDPRRHALSDAVAIVGLRPFNAIRATAADASHALIGKDGGPWQPAALGDDLRAELDDLRTKFAAHTHVVAATGPDPQGGVVTSTGTAAATTTTLAAARTVRSATVKVSE